MIQFAKTTTRLLMLVTLGTFAVVSALADSPSSHLPSAGLVILPEPQLSLTDRNQADYGCGRINSLDTAQVEHSFTLRNEGGAPLTITQLQPSCHCTGVTIEKIAGRKPTESEATDPVLAPKEEMVLKVKVVLARQPAGPLSQGVYIFALGHNGPIARLNIVGTLTTGLTVNPTALDFGSMKPGEIRSRKITLTFDDRLVSGGSLPPIHFQSDPQSASGTDSLIKITPETDSSSAGSAMRVKSYVITVQPSQSDDVVAHLFFAPLNPAEYQGTIPYDTARDVFREMAVSVCAQVTGK